MQRVHDAAWRGFASDNYAGVHHKVLEAIAAVNGGHQVAYGEDVYTEHLHQVMTTHFGMGIEDMARIRPTLPQPVLRKDFFIDDYQILEARAHGADAILLMANVLDATKLHDFHQLARELGMEALFEIHTLDEIALLPKSARVVGINSRKFKSTSGFVGSAGSSQKDFSLEMSVFDLVTHLPAGCLRVAESGLAPETIASVSSKFDAALVGTSLLRDPRGLEACLADFERAIEAHPHCHGN